MSWVCGESSRKRDGASGEGEDEGRHAESQGVELALPRESDEEVWSLGDEIR